MIVLSCSNDENTSENDDLDAYIQSKIHQLGAVIACAASDENSDDVLVFYYPEDGATDIRLYESDNINIDPNEFSNYTKIDAFPTPFFNGYLGKFNRDLALEKWAVVTYEFNDTIRISNPIRLKQDSKPTIWSESVSINQNDSMMPKFTWIDNEFGENAIYFQVISDVQDNLLSGTYTYENQFQYYNTDNVVLNITSEPPPDLIVGNFYKFTLMDVSLDNWVNGVIQKNFESQ